MSVPNQKIVTIAPRIPRDKEHLYSKMNIDSIKTAVTILNGSGLKLWLYCNKNIDNYTFELSQKACLDFGIKKDSYYNGVEELIKKGYFIQEYEGSNHFCFYETPHKNISEDKNWFSEESIVEVEYPKKSSENTERNIIKLQNKIKKITERTSPSEKKKSGDFSYLEEEIGSDTSLTVLDMWIDTMLPSFYLLNRKLQTKYLMKFGFEEDECEYILDNIIDYKDGDYSEDYFVNREEYDMYDDFRKYEEYFGKRCKRIYDDFMKCKIDKKKSPKEYFDNLKKTYLSIFLGGLDMSLEELLKEEEVS